MAVSRSQARSASSMSRAHTFRWDVGPMDIARTSALNPLACADVDSFEQAISCDKGQTACWNESDARTGKSRYSGSVFISKAWKPFFANTLSYEMLLRWRERAATLARRRSSRM